MQLLSNLINGASLGLIFGVVGMGFVIIYRSTHVISFAHGSLLMVGVYVMYHAQDALGFVPAVLLGTLVTAVAAGLLHLVLLHPVRLAPPDVAAVITIAVNIALAAALTDALGPRILSVDAPWGSDTVSMGDIRIPVSRICALVVAAIIFAAVALSNRYTMAGLTARAVAEDREVASLMGARISVVSLVAWLLGGVFAAVAGLFLTAYPNIGLMSGTSHVAMLAFPAVVIGGLDSIGGAVVGGLIVGITQTLVLDYQHSLTFLAGFDTTVPWVAMVLVLLVRPTGLFGKKPLYRI